MLNKAILMGRLTRDPEMRRTQSNTAVASFTLAIDRDRKDQSGQRQTDFIDCIAWGRQAEFVCQWFTKGMMAIVCGRVQSRNWEDRNGNKRTSIEVNCDEINFGETKKARDHGGYAAQPQYNSAPAEPARGNGFPLPDSEDYSELDDDDDVPF